MEDKRPVGRPPKERFEEDNSDPYFKNPNRKTLEVFPNNIKETYWQAHLRLNKAIYIAVSIFYGLAIAGYIVIEIILMKQP